MRKLKLMHRNVSKLEGILQNISNWQSLYFQRGSRRSLEKYNKAEEEKYFRKVGSHLDIDTFFIIMHTLKRSHKHKTTTKTSRQVMQTRYSECQSSRQYSFLIHRVKTIFKITRMLPLSILCITNHHRGENYKTQAENC